MNWKYYIPHVWESPEDRTEWEDVWLLPEDGSNDGRSYWFTLNALTFGAGGVDEEYPEAADGPFGRDTAALVKEMNLRLLGDRDYLITSTLDMIARVDNFNLSELLEWTRVFIRDHFGDPDPVLILGDYTDFAGTNKHAAEIGRITEAVASGVPEEEIIDYRPSLRGDGSDPPVN